MKVFLSPSSQYENKYNDGIHNEGQVCRWIAEKVQDLLSSGGIDCKIGSATSMYDRVKESNAWGSDFHVCIHTNAGGGEGTEIFVYNTVSYPKQASIMLNNLVNVTKKNRGIKGSGNLFEVRATTMPCIYAELEFHDTKGAWIVEHMNELAHAIASTFCDCTEKAEELPKEQKYYRCQLGAFTTKERCQAFCKELKNKYGLDTIVKYY